MNIPALLLVLVSSALATHNAPGTNSRPILHPQEAQHFTKGKYFQGWKPPSLSTTQADYSVDGGQYKTIQSAVNAAIKAGGTTRKYIKVKAGTYREPVYIPNTNVPLTIYGAGGSSSDTVIVFKLAAQTSSGEYQNAVGRHFKSGDPAFKMFKSCAKKEKIGTSCSAIFWVKAPNVQIIKLTVQNTASTAGDSQAVALLIDNDRIQVHDSRFLSHQDTFYLGGSGTNAQRSHITQTYIEGDIDFVFGGGSAVFEQCRFRVKADRRSNTATIFAPSTNAHKQYGILVYNSKIEGDSTWYSSQTVNLARAWDAGVSSPSAYVIGTSPNGQLVIRDTTIELILQLNAPYTTSTSSRKYSGNTASNRDLNNNNFNRFWEFNNRGGGA